MNASPKAATTGTSVSRANPRKFGRMKLMPMRVLRRDCRPVVPDPADVAVGAVGGAAVMAMVLLRRSARAGPWRPARANDC